MIKAHLCLYCNIEINYTEDSKKDITTHYYNSHRKKLKQDFKSIANFIKTYFYNNEIPLCKCGCNESVDYFIPGKNRWAFLKRGHYSRLEGCNPTRDNKEIAKLVGKHMIETKNKRKAEGKIYEAWNKGLDISDSRVESYAKHSRGKTIEERCGVEKASKFKKLLSERMKQRYIDNPNLILHLNKKRKEYWDKKENKVAAGKRASERIIKNSFKTSKFEKDVLEFLIKNNIEVVSQYRISDMNYNKVYDFKIKDKNILIECDGDFHHCNLEKFPNGPKYKTQYIHLENDKIKNELAKTHFFKLIRIWHSEFYKNNYLLLDRINQETL